ncbi:MAG: hypothetical protein F6K35_36170 [Okeania sp. SIO2H7]|nr:hypothetical protein [Okeania sp. SIO2H7]
MFVSDLSVEKWVGNKDEGSLMENPSWQQIESAICQLNGTTQTLVTLGADEETYMSIGGGEAGKYIVNVTLDGMTFYNLVDRTSSELIEKLVVGGQLGNYRAKMLTNLQTALLVAKTFAGTGELDESVTWEEDEFLAMVG